MPQAVIALPSLPPLFSPQDDQWPSLWRGGAGEFFATMVFVFVGTGAVVACQTQLGSLTIHVSSQILISLAHGFAIMVLVYAVGEVSGGKNKFLYSYKVVMNIEISRIFIHYFYS